jgi:ubiquinone/menaquinone biosynthesis C-methylase UbiE
MALPLDNTHFQYPDRKPRRLGTAWFGHISHYHLMIIMTDLHDQKSLKQEQYKNADRLQARIQLHQKFSTNPYGWFKWVFDQFDLSPKKKLLEIGCGSGALWLDNKDRIPPTWQVTLSDFSAGMVAESKRNLGDSSEQITYEVSDGRFAPFANQTFDAVIANHMLYHINQRQDALAEINRILKPGGTFFASTIGENHLKELSQIMADFNLSYRNYYSPALDPSGFTLENGFHQLSPWFEQIDIHRYPDALVVTDAEPLVGYILSMLSKSEIEGIRNDIENLSETFDKLIKQQGSIIIQKSSGIFVGRKRGIDHD